MPTNALQDADNTVSRLNGHGDRLLRAAQAMTSASCDCGSKDIRITWVCQDSDLIFCLEAECFDCGTCFDVDEFGKLTEA